MTLPLHKLAEDQVAANERLLFFFVLMTQLSDALQYAWSKLPSRHLLVPTISQTRTIFWGRTVFVTIM